MERGEPLRSVHIHQSGNTGNTIGQMSGGTVNYTIDECRRELEECKAEKTKLATDLASARGRIIDLMDKK